MNAAPRRRRVVALIAVLSLALAGAACGDDGESADTKKTATTAAGSGTPDVTAVPGGPATIDQDLSGLDAELGQMDGELADLDQGVGAQGGVGQ